MNSLGVIGQDAFISAAAPLLELITHITGLETSFVTTIDWQAKQQTVLLAQNTGSLQVESGSQVAWTDSMCQLMLSEHLTATTEIQLRFPESGGALQGMQSFVVLPIKIADQMIGTLCGASDEKVELNDYHIKSLGYIADALALQLKLTIDARNAEAKVDSLRDQIENLATLANTDPLTELLNRRAFQHRYEFAIKLTKRTKQPLSVMMIDIDGFKQFNDEFGHETGDAIIKIVGEGLKHIARSTDIPCRVGGDEFILAALNTDSDGLSLLAERLREYVKLHSNKLQRPCSLSIGIACSRHGAPEELIRFADEALYMSKASGRDAISVYQPD
uniref:sensor domain-containing diguanylate cyclase n=1 Tax=Cellvibrio fontiphilus TaxID=1815559 RepID=UPI002B4BA545|nr:sensor domain-containing diguanylate cyclase [Cellvibrio fontiphilus]